MLCSQGFLIIFCVVYNRYPSVPPQSLPFFKCLCNIHCTHLEYTHILHAYCIHTYILYCTCRTHNILQTLYSHAHINCMHIVYTLLYCMYMIYAHTLYTYWIHIHNRIHSLYTHILHILHTLTYMLTYMSHIHAHTHKIHIIT